MKKTFSAFVVLIMLLMLPRISSGAEIGPYVSGNLGVAFLNESNVTVSEGESDSVVIDYERGVAGSFAAGYNFGMVRVEAEFGYQGNKADYSFHEHDDVNYYYDNNHGLVDYNESDMKAYSFMGNFYFDFINSTPVTPFLTIGLGIADVELFADKDNVMAYQAGAGIAFELTPHMSIDLKYRYFATDDLSFAGYNVEFASHNVYAGFRYTF
jgi:opacity protein-like surface antigen